MLWADGFSPAKARPPGWALLPLTRHSLLWLGKEANIFLKKQNKPPQTNRNKPPEQPRNPPSEFLLLCLGLPPLALKQSCSQGTTGSPLNLSPQGFPLPAHRWCLPKPSASLMHTEPSVSSLLLTEASVCAWQSKKQAAFLLESPFCQPAEIWLCLNFAAELVNSG